jgi:imidazolonepropionase-like amidohydrolase
MANAKRAFPVMQRAIGVLHQHGVRLTVGTDLENPWMTPGASYHRELELLAGAGISPLDVLTIATRNGAEALGMLNEAGTIAVGKRADLVVLGGDPVADIRNTRKVERVWLGTRELDPAALAAMSETSGTPPR